MGNQIIVVYKSSTGFTKKYAEIIAGKLKCPLAGYQTVTAKELAACDLVIFGSRAHAGRIDGYKKIREWYQKHKIQKLVIFVTGATPNASKQILSDFWKQNLSADELKRIPHFYMQAGLCYEKMSFTDKLMMKAAAVMLQKKKDKDDTDKEFERAIAGSYDISSEKYAEPLIAYVKKSMKSQRV